eukprot:GDKI01029805.1.p2 GENE.GDKI01029805.1~~GDKI01029805.1.p2  ORF type:complete len:154 (+),score=25.96 GDKI01029805.1:57-464(+)
MMSADQTSTAYTASSETQNPPTNGGVSEETGVMGKAKRVGAVILDNLSFAGEVLVDWWGLNKHPYQHIIDDIERKKQRNRERREREVARREFEESTRMEGGAVGDAVSGDAAEGVSDKVVSRVQGNIDAAVRTSI